MKKRILFYIPLLLISSLLLSNASLAQEYTQGHLPEGAKMRLGKGRANDITFSPNGTQFAVTTSIGIWIYDARTGTEITMIKQSGRGFGKVAFSPDGHTLACATGNLGRGEVQLWDKAAGKLVTTLPSPIGLSSLFFSEDGTKLACAGYFGRVHVWEIGTETPPVLITDVKLDFDSWSDFWLTELSPDRRFLAIAIPGWKDRNFSIQLRDGTTGELLHTLTGHTRAVKSLTFSPDSKILVSGDEYETIRMWDTETGNLKSTMNWRLGTSTHALGFSPKGRFLASGHRDGVRLWHYTVDEGQQWDHAIGEYQNIMDLKEHKDYIYKFAFSPDEMTLLTGSKDGTIIAWDTTTGNRRFTCEGHFGGIKGVALSETDGTITTLNQPVNPPGVFQQRRWDINTGELLSTTFEKGIDATTMGVSPDGKTIVTHSVSGKCVLWDISSESPQMITRFALNDFPRAGLNVRFAFALDGKMLAAGGQDHTVHVWDIINNSLQHKFTTKEHTNYVWSLAFSPDGKKLASGSRDEKFRISNIEDAKTLYLLGGHNWRVNSFAFSPDNKILASGSYELFLWDVESGTQIKHIKRRQRSIIWALAFSPDGNMLLIGGGDGLEMYDLPSGRMLTLDPGFTNILKLFANGKTLVSGSNSGGILVWDWEKVAQMAKQKLAASAPKPVASYQKFHVITHNLDETEDLKAECKRQLGEGVRLADWNDLLAYYEAGGSMEDFIAKLKIPLEYINPEDLEAIPNASYRISKNGELRWNAGRRHYFFARHDHRKRAGFLAHDNIDNYLLSLGSWFGKGGFALCYGDLNSTVPPPEPPESPEPPEIILSPPSSQLLDR